MEKLTLEGYMRDDHREGILYPRKEGFEENPIDWPENGSIEEIEEHIDLLDKKKDIIKEINDFVGGGKIKITVKKIDKN